MPENPAYQRARPLPPGESPKAAGSLIPVMVVLVSVLTMAVGIVMFTGVIGLYMLAAVCGLLALPVLHYLTWGWWLSKAIREKEQQDDDQRGQS